MHCVHVLVLSSKNSVVSHKGVTVVPKWTGRVAKVHKLVFRRLTDYESTDSSLFALCLYDFVLLSWKNPVVYHKGVVVHNRTGWPVRVHESFFRRPVLRMATLKTASSLMFALCRCSVVAEDDVWCHRDVCHVLKRTSQVNERSA